MNTTVDKVEDLFSEPVGSLHNQANAEGINAAIKYWREFEEYLSLKNPPKKTSKPRRNNQSYNVKNIYSQRLAKMYADRTKQRNVKAAKSKRNAKEARGKSNMPRRPSPKEETKNPDSDPTENSKVQETESTRKLLKECIHNVAKLLQEVKGKDLTKSKKDSKSSTSRKFSSKSVGSRKKTPEAGDLTKFGGKGVGGATGVDKF